jgi:hypothetical protein
MSRFNDARYDDGTLYPMNRLEDGTVEVSDAGTLVIAIAETQFANGNHAGTAIDYVMITP